ncbi:MAG: GDP-mannose 4,6-dehydratase, partial [Pseudomonadota bacterium]
VVSNFIVQALKGQNITIYGEGQQTRSFCYVDDLVEGLIRLMRSAPERGRDPINLGNPGEFTIRELAEMVIDMTGSASKLVFLPLPADDPQQRKPDISRAKEQLDWEPKVPLKDGLAKTIDYFDHVLRTDGQASEPVRLPNAAANAPLSLAG